MKQFFIAFFANLFALGFFFLAPLLLLVLLIVSAASVNTGKPNLTIEQNSILVMDMSVNLTDAPEHASPTDALGSALDNSTTRSVALRQVLRSLNKAAKDDRIKALFLYGSFTPADYGTGYASLKELRDAILHFKESGKKVYAYLEAPSTRDYYVSSVANVIYLNPFGELETPGLAAIKTYYKNAFDKYGIDVQVTRVGKYKSAVEPFILNKMSDADREETQKLIGDLWNEVVTSAGASRKVDPAAFQQLVDKEGYIQPEDAQSNGLVDKLSYFGDVLKDLGEISPPSDTDDTDHVPFRQVSLGDYMNLGKTPKLKVEKNSGNLVALLYMEGEIVDGWGDKTNIGGDRFSAQLRLLAQDDDVKAVVLRVNSPGGSAFASEAIQHELLALKVKKPVIISMGNYAASGGYWISTYGDYIFAEPNTLTGSIGVFGMFFNVQKLSDTIGVTYDTAKTGNFADFETITRPKSPQELQLAQTRVDDIYAKFIDRVSKSRNLPAANVEAIAQGRVWSGIEAKSLGLVDDIGGMGKAITYAAKKAGIEKDYKVKEYPAQLTLAEALAQLFSGEEQPVIRAKADPLTHAMLQMRHDLTELQSFNDPLGVYARLPLGLEIK